MRNVMFVGFSVIWLDKSVFGERDNTLPALDLCAVPVMLLPFHIEPDSPFVAQGRFRNVDAGKVERAYFASSLLGMCCDRLLNSCPTFLAVRAKGANE